MKRRNWLKLCCMAGIVIILVQFSVCALAVTVDYGKNGSISVALETTDERDDWSGVQISLYRVGDVDNSNADLHYPINAQFASSGVDLNVTTSAEAEAAAQKLSDFIEQNSIGALSTKTTDQDGKTVFPDLPVGMYFAMKTGGTKYIDILPFIVSVPLYEEKELTYDVTVCPKMEVFPEPTPTPEPSPTPTPPPHLPQTGVTRWPVIALAWLALLLIVVGSEQCARRGNQQRNDA